MWWIMNGLFFLAGKVVRGLLLEGSLLEELLLLGEASFEMVYKLKLST